MKYLRFINTNYLIIIMLLLSFKGISQNASDTDIMETIIPSGSNATSASGTVSYSIGQVFYMYIGESAYNVAQGVQQQEKDKTLDTPDIEVPTTQLFVFPNPTTDYVNLSIKGLEIENGIRHYQLYDLQGRLLQQNIINDTETQISLSNLSSSLYILTVYIDNQVLKTFKILKN